MERVKRYAPGVIELESAEAVIARYPALDHMMVQGVDLRGTGLDWTRAEVAGTVFLGCRFARDETPAILLERGAAIFPRLGELPYDPYRRTLYTPRELLDGWSPEGKPSRDLLVYRHFVAAGGPFPDVREALSQRLHDHAIEDALHDHLDFDSEGLPRRRAVGIMGGHGEPRGSAAYRQAADLGRGLARRGFLVVTGGGPGMMEAGNFGAWSAEQDREAVDEALSSLAAAPAMEDAGYLERALEIHDLLAAGAESLGVPTWFYGHEPTNLFSTRVAKYFSNSLREDGLLALCMYGVVFTPGSAGTIQEIFQDLTQNHYRTFGHRSPMVFLGEHPVAVLRAVRELARRGGYEHLVHESLDAEEAAEFIARTPPEAPPEREAGPSG